MKAATDLPIGVQRVYVDNLLDNAPLKPTQLIVFAICALVALLDGMDSQSIGVAGPVMAADLHLKMSHFTPALSAGLLGATIGALAFGGLADRFGRKPVLVASTALFGLFTLLTATSSTFSGLLLLRFIAGLGLGGATPCFITLAAEFSPSQHRPAISSLIWATFPLGNALGGFTSGYIVSHFRWQMVFLVAGVPTVVLALFMALALPESLRYLVARQRHPARAERIARRLEPSLSAGPFQLLARRAEDLLPDAALRQRTSLVSSMFALFSDQRAVGTLLIWLILYLGLGTTTVMVLMSPTLLHSDGIKLGMTGALVGVFSISSMLSMAIAGRLIQIVGPALALSPAFLIGAAFIVILGHLHSPLLLGLCMMIIGLSAPLGVAGGIALAATFYPIHIRSSGVGWGMGFGRFGQVCSPLVIGLMLSLSWEPIKILTAMAAAPFLAGLAIACFSWSVRIKTPGTPVPVLPNELSESL
jgi:MFS transporter, AAHS family, 4-hydroxybenzoate transporter